MTFPSLGLACSPQTGVTKMAEAQKNSSTDNTKSASGNRITLIILAAMAVLGWGWGIYQATNRSALEEDMTRRIEAATLERDEVAAAFAALEVAAGELSDVQGQIEASNEELTGLDERRREAKSEFDAELDALAERRSTAETEMASEIARMTAELETARQDFETELGGLVERRQLAMRQTEEVEASLGETRGQLEQATQQLQSRRSELDVLEQDITSAEDKRAEAETSLTEIAQKLEAVGARLTTAREQEGSLRDTLSTLQEEAASTTKELADAEARIQEARSAEAKLQQQSERISKEVAALEERQEELKVNVADLEARRSDLEDDVKAAEDQRAKVQAEVSDVTKLLEQRSDELLEVEDRIVEQLENGDASTGATAQGQDASTPEQEKTAGESSTTGGSSDQAQPQIQPGTYNSETLIAQFAADGTFSMRNEEKQAEVSGEYSVTNGIVTLSNPIGDVRSGVKFPMRCAVASDGQGFTLNEVADDGPSCGPLADVRFSAVR